MSQEIITELVTEDLAMAEVKVTELASGEMGSTLFDTALNVGMGHYLVVAAILFTLGIFGIFLNRKNMIVILMSIELMLLAVIINLVTFSNYLEDLTGQVFSMFILTVAAAEAAIGLAILVTFFRNRGDISVETINELKG